MINNISGSSIPPDYGNGNVHPMDDVQKDQAQQSDGDSIRDIMLNIAKDSTIDKNTKLEKLDQVRNEALKALESEPDPAIRQQKASEINKSYRLAVTLVELADRPRPSFPPSPPSYP